MAYSVEKARELVLKAGLELCEAGLVARTWGNISARVSDTQYVITPSGRAYDTLTAEDIVLVNITDGSYVGEVKPSGEKGVHAAVYELCPEMNFVIHTHQNYASALSVLGRELEIEGAVEGKKGENCNIEDSREKTGECLLGNVLSCADYGMYATEELVNNIKTQIMTHPKSKAVLMKYHGALCFGKDYDEAFAVAYELEKFSEVIFKKMCEEGERVSQSDKNTEGKGCYRAEHEGICPSENIENSECTFEIPSELQQQLATRDDISSILLAQTPYIVKMSNLGNTMEPYLDDVAQIAGVDVKCVDLENCEAGQASTDTKTVEDTMPTLSQTLLDALTDRNAVLIKGIGALCTGFDECEAEAVAIVLEKTCMAAYLAHCVGNVPPLGKESAKKDREGYVNHYSKLK